MVIVIHSYVSFPRAVFAGRRYRPLPAFLVAKAGRCLDELVYALTDQVGHRHAPLGGQGFKRARLLFS
jgi:hypothetical protein